MIETTNPVRGTKDYLPKEMALREKIRAIILNTYEKYGFSQIKTPIIENINLLLGSDGGDNLKLIYKILKRGEKLDLNNVKDENDLVDSGLRYDLTVPLVRFYANNNSKLLPVFKSIQIGDVFRAERPQKGRSRQFCQCDIDIINDASINAEIEVLYVSAMAMLNLGFKNFKIKINDRRILNSIILFAGFKKEEVNDVSISVDKVDKIGLDGVKNELIEKKYNKARVENLVRILEDVKNNGLDTLNKYSVSNNVIDNVKNIISAIKELSNNEFEIEFDINIIRGQGYYTATVFEIYVEGFAGACGGGGRYDEMIEKMINRSVPAVGFSLGFERLFLIISEKNMLKKQTPLLALIYEENDDFKEVIKYANKLQKEYNVNALKRRNNFSYQLTNLKENGYNKYVLFSTKKIETIN